MNYILFPQNCNVKSYFFFLLVFTNDLFLSWVCSSDWNYRVHVYKQFYCSFLTPRLRYKKMSMGRAPGSGWSVPFSHIWASIRFCLFWKIECFCLLYNGNSDTAFEKHPISCILNMFISECMNVNIEDFDKGKKKGLQEVVCLSLGKSCYLQ